MANDMKKLAKAGALLAGAVEALGTRLAEVTDRVEQLEADKADLERKAEVVQAAQRSWRVLLRVQGDLLLASEAGQTCRVPISVCRTLAAGRPLDLDVRDAGEANVELADYAGRVVASLPRAALLALPRVLASPEVGRLLAAGSTTTSRVASRSCTSAAAATGRMDRRYSPEGGVTGPATRGCRPGADEGVDA